MSRIVALSFALSMVLGSLACDAPPAKGKADKKAPAAKQAPPAPTPEPAKPVEPAKPAEVVAPVEPTPPTEPAVPTEPAPPSEAVAPTEPAPSEPAPAAGWTPPANPTDMRGDEVIPPGTPEINAKAFKKLAFAPGDGAPRGGIGANGIHLDQLELGRDWAKSHCTDPTTTFKVGVDKQANVCMRVIHPRGVSEELSIEWQKNGKSARRSKVGVKDLHAYLTRGYLPISPGYEGKWTAIITSSDGAVIGKLDFTVE